MVRDGGGGDGRGRRVWGGTATATMGDGMAGAAAAAREGPPLGRPPDAASRGDRGDAAGVGDNRDIAAGADGNRVDATSDAADDDGHRGEDSGVDGTTAEPAAGSTVPGTVNGVGDISAQYPARNHKCAEKE